MNVPLNPELCWQAVLKRDAAQDGRFYYGVITTGVYCRPSCAARPAKRENVRFYASPAEAEGDGLRACLRCHPLAISGHDPMTAKIRELCAYIDGHPGEPLKLAELAARVKLSPFHVQRAFKAIVGVSPKQYADAARMKTFQGLLRKPEGLDVTGAIFEAGFGSLSRLYEKTDTRLGMTPMEYREGGKGVSISWATAQTPLGLMMVGATDRGLCFVQFGESETVLRRELEKQYPNASVRPLGEPKPTLFDAWMDGLNQYLVGRQPDAGLPVHVRATAFQLMVWKYLQTIPRGAVQSYQEVAQGIGRPSAARAVARACASNSLAIVIPCHRVIRGTGELGGYRWGLERKRAVLDSERRAKGA
jgi:AraC family transcriptional regulator of adaptative response/methylated-DNA-[protein]-cysteine methyltransferase